MTLKEMRKASGLTQKELAEKSGIIQSSISMYENGERQPSADNMIKMAKALNCSAEQIYFAIKNPEMG